jgi:O-antigen/teichoic acid export membrane protein
MRRKFGYVPRPKIHIAIVRTVAKYSLVNYFTTFISSLPAFALPLLVTSTLGVRANAVYFVAYNIAGMLFLIPLGVANAMFAEASHDEGALRHFLARAGRITAALLLPGVAIVTLFAPVILSLFGKHYAEQGVAVLRILALCALCYAVTYPCGAVLNVMHRLRPLIVINVFAATVVIGLADFLLRDGDGLTGAAWGWSLGWCATAFVYVVTVAFALRGP